MGITLVIKTTPIKAFEVLLSILHVDFFIDREAVITARRLGQANILQENSKYIPELLMGTDQCTPQYFFEKILKIISHRDLTWKAPTIYLIQKI